MAVEFDGRNFYKSTDIGLDDFAASQYVDKVRRKNLEALFAEEDAKLPEIALQTWNTVMRHGHPTITQFEHSHAGEANRIKQLVAAWKDGHRFNIVISSPNNDRDSDKTDTAYACVDAMIREGLFLTPQEEVVFVSEEDVTRVEYGEVVGATRIFENHPNVKLLVVDNVLQGADSPKFQLAWSRLLYHCRENANGKVYLMLIVHPSFTGNASSSHTSNSDNSHGGTLGQYAKRTITLGNAPVKKPATLGDVMGGKTATYGVQCILPLEKYSESYPKGCKMARGIVVQ